MDHCLVYFSNSVGLFEQEDLLAILAQSRCNNAVAGITGVLLYVRGSIVQVLEGPKPTLEALYQRIAADPRHTNVTKVINRPIQERVFGRWSMGYETMTTQQLEEIEAIVNLAKAENSLTETGEPVLLRMLKLFYESNRFN